MENLAFDMGELRNNLPKKWCHVLDSVENLVSGLVAGYIHPEGISRVLTQITFWRGLSRYYSGKARSFVCISDVKCLEDLKKPTYFLDDDDDNAYMEKRKKKKQSSSSSFSVNNNTNLNFQNYPCRRVSSSTHFSSPCVA